MSDQYILAILEADCSPPMGSHLHHGSDEYFFYPFEHDSVILTIDAIFWDESRSHASKRKSVINMWPNKTLVSECLSYVANVNNWTLFAITHASVGQTIDPNRCISLTPLPELSPGFFDAGYDVVDICGLSALTNVGYTDHDIALLKRYSMKITVHGLIAELQDAQEFAKFASNTAPEHAPFSPVKILAINGGTEECRVSRGVQGQGYT